MKRTTLPVLLGLGLLTAVAGFAKSKGESPVPVAQAETPKAVVADEDANLTPSQKMALAKIKDGNGTGVDRTITEAQAQVRKQPKKDEQWIVLAHAWIRKARESNDPGFYLNADAAAQAVLDHQPDNRLALDVRGLVMMNNHEFEKARDLAKKIVEKHPEDPMAWGTLSDALLEMGRYEEATDAAQQMLDLKPNLPSYSRASYLQWLHGQTKDAKDTVRLALDSGRAAKSDPEPGAWVFVQAAQIFWTESDFEATEEGADQALLRMTNFAPANVVKGRLAMARGEGKRAAELFERAYKASPLAETAWLLGDAKSMAGDEAGAAKAYADVEKEGKSDPRTLALFYATKNQNIDKAVELATKEFEVRKDVYTEDTLAWSLYRAGKTKEARSHMEHAARLGTPDPRLVYHSGAILVASGDKERGLQLVRGALRMNKSFDYTGAKEASAMVTR